MESLPSGASILVDESLSKYTSYRIGGSARFLAMPRNAEDLAVLAKKIRQGGLPYAVLGNGSNVLAPDEGFPGVVICTRELCQSELDFLPNHQVQVGAGVLNSRLLRAAADRGLGGIVFLSGVPGNVGGAVYMNAGTREGWISDRLEEVKGFSLSQGERVHGKTNLKYSYREQHYLAEDEIILSARLQLIPGEPKALKDELAESIRRRKGAQPIELPSCGSVFRNPVGQNAWRLIADAGLRGLKQGGARISEKHSNFIVNEGGATKADVLFLIQLAKEKVLAKTGISLQEEVVVLQPRRLL